VVANVATVATTSDDFDAANNQATARTTVGATADLALTNLGPLSATPGTNVVFTLTVTNAGPSAAAGVTLANPTPAGLTFVSATGPCTAGFPCPIGALAKDAFTSVTATFAVPAAY